VADATRPTVLTTGAAGHVGGALLRLSTAAGYRTIGVDRPGTAPAGPGGEVDRWLEVDLAEPAARAALAAVLADEPRLDVVVAGAGVTALGTFEATDDATFERVLAVNLLGAVRTAQASLPQLRAARGYLVVISSVAGLLPVPGRPAYVAAKHAVTGTFLAVADELRRDGIDVTVLHPAFLRTSVTAVGGGAVRTVTGAALEADDVARTVLRLIARQRAGRRVPTRVLVGRTARLADAAQRLTPERARRLAARRLRA
jgi:NAD(P)-dependent dehydrogenase (short-subunit alcohol dehydrogenase family)